MPHISELQQAVGQDTAAAYRRLGRPSPLSAVRLAVILVAALISLTCERGVGFGRPPAQERSVHCEPPAHCEPLAMPAPAALQSALSAQAQPIARCALGAPLSPIEDDGIYGDLAPLVRVVFPEWLRGQRVEVMADRTNRPFVYVGAHAVAFADSSVTSGIRVLVESFAPQDIDGDGVPDALDILLGAKKVMLAAAPYKETYRKLPYPNGDLPRDEGVCTDVVIRALRNAGFDLQRLVHEDIVAAPRAYPRVQRTDTSVDHRRVRNLLPYFSRHWDRLPGDPHESSAPWLPGDVVFLDTLRAPGPDHIGIVSDLPGRSGLPLVINSWTNGYVTQEMDLLSFVPVTHRFRVPARGLRRLAECQGTAAQPAPDAPSTGSGL